MTDDNLIDKIWYQVRTPGGLISLQTTFWPDWINFGKIDFQKSSKSCYNPLIVNQFKNFNLGNHAEFNSLSANI